LSNVAAKKYLAADLYRLLFSSAKPAAHFTLQSVPKSSLFYSNCILSIKFIYNYVKAHDYMIDIQSIFNFVYIIQNVWPVFEEYANLKGEWNEINHKILIIFENRWLDILKTLSFLNGLSLACI
jgi:hypothetical protein